MKKIQLRGIENAMDLGGIKTRDGKRIRSKMLIRSGGLSRAEESDIKKLTEEYNVKLIVDLRTKEERDVMKEPEIKGVSVIWNPLFSENVQGAGVFTPDEKDTLENHLKSIFIVRYRADDKTKEALDQVRTMIQGEEFDPDAYMARMYQKFVNNQVVQKQVKQFFSILSNNRDGAILWHCSAGKDRSGIITALLLYALGVSKEDIIKNYMEVSQSSEDAVDYLLEKLFPASEPDNLEYQAIARRLFGVKTCYIESFFDAVEKDYSSLDNYLQKALELHVDNLVRLRTLYLE